MPAVAGAQTVIYVAADAPAGGNGQTWATACNNLHTALAVASADTEVWVKQGTYATETMFRLPTGVGLFGGFAGTESSRAMANPAAFVTTLSGMNQTTVFFVQETGPDTRVDGFRITDARPYPFPISSGSGVLVSGGWLAISRCTFEDCQARGAPDFMGGGGGVRILSGANVRILDSIFRNCSGYPGYGFNTTYGGSGGAVYIGEGSMATFERCSFLSNSSGPPVSVCAGGNLYRGVGGRGGAIYADSSTLRLVNCVFQDNHVPPGENATFACIPIMEYGATLASDGGAIYARGTSINAASCVFEANSTQSGGAGLADRWPATWGGSGGAIYQTGGGAQFEHCVFARNRTGNEGGSDMSQSAGAGGDGSAIFSDSILLVLRGCVFYANRTGEGGQVWNMPSQSGTPGRGAGIYAPAPTIINCTFVGNSSSSAAAGVSAPNASISNSIFFNNSTLGLQDQAAQTDATSASNSCIQGLSTITGPGNIVAPPLFRDPDGPDDIPGTLDDDYSLAPASPRIDAGSNTLLPASLVIDILGHPRRRDDPRTPDHGVGPAPIVDIGAYEFQPCIADFDDGGGLGTPDGGVTTEDLLYFLVRYGQGC